MPKLILLEGFAGSGKSTIAKRYIDEHPLAMSLEGDQLITMFGQWLKHEDAARDRVFALTKTMIATCLDAGSDVVVPYLPTHPDHARDFEQIAHKLGATFFEVVLEVDRPDAIRRLLQRGSWGEEGTEPITDADMPTIHDLHDRMTIALENRPDATRISCVEGDIDATYQQFMDALH